MDNSGGIGALLRSKLGAPSEAIDGEAAETDMSSLDGGRNASGFLATVPNDGGGQIRIVTAAALRSAVCDFRKLGRMVALERIGDGEALMSVECAT